MDGIDSAISQEMGSVLKRGYGILLLLSFTSDYIHAPQIMAILFLAPPDDAFKYNPNAGNQTQTIISEWNFTEAEKNWIPGFLQSIFFVGFMIGTVLFGQLADKFGRWSVSWKVYTGLLIVAFATAFTQNWKQMAVCRFLSGLGIGGLSVMNIILMQEMCAARLWVLNGTMGSVTFSISSLILVIFGYYFPSWRTLCIVTTLPAMAGYIFYIVIPESPRWLMTQKRIYEAEKVMQRISSWNGKTKFDYHSLENEVKPVDDTPTTPTFTKAVDKKNSILDLITHPVLRYRTAILSFEWFTTSFVYYCLTLGAASFSPNFYLAFGMSSLSQLPAAPLCIYFMDRKWCGRRGTLCIMMFMSAISLFIIYILPNTDANGHYRLLLSMVAKVGSAGCFTLVYVFTPELYPTVVRNVGLGSMSTIARIGSMTAPFLATYTVNSGSETPFLCYGILCGLAGVLAFCLPETCGKRIINTIDEAYEHEEDYQESSS